ncbi:hypothetical protein B0H19DRAFT_1180680 [Mycena capillaripes]|nr:hypothetical protein B0H19DRAFT_1180680 [Mycena capillaripes]
MSTAKVTVASTPELLELILTHLPMRDLLVAAPLVSKTWQTITLSPTLQRALFFQADPSSEPICNPLLVEMFPPFFAQPGENRWLWPGKASSIMAMPWSKAPGAFKRKEASWRRMLVAQPPVQKMIITETRHNRGGDSERRAVVNDLSLRMGRLYDLALPFIDRVASSFCIQWREDASREGDLTLAVIYTKQCSLHFRRMIDEEFYSDGHLDRFREFGGKRLTKTPNLMWIES